MSLWRILLFCIVCIHQVCCSEEHITGYLGQSVVLKSGADRAWNLSKVQWSIYQNTTYIASLKDGIVTIFKFWRHQGRLELNSKTGDLTINNVKMDDSMTYTVALVNSEDTRRKVKVHLIVQEKLKKPNIQKMFDSHKDGQCHVALNCTAFGQNVNLSWTPSGEFNGSYISGNAVDSSLVLFMSFSGNRNVTLNCTASSGQQTETKQMTVGCSEEKQGCEVCTICSSCSSCASSVTWAVVLVIAGVFALACAFTQKELKMPSLPSSISSGVYVTVLNPVVMRCDQLGKDTKEDKQTSFA
ncbi:T-lymphocyte surface antigen Ly-9 isoform X2 [Ctenopharyngodon idella]|uniref:T-lymphocyte surface antigen Ly-9 isoform X2 n=1 Tax=Ctenopharyngodon idella TaxID=7959 RepID=UPI00222F4333|nr:T-lymphocyte surface antigen Ly-9 isoform X2 [Ctenopharyngodon idella]